VRKIRNTGGVLVLMTITACGAVGSTGSTASPAATAEPTSAATATSVSTSTRSTAVATTAAVATTTPAPSTTASAGFVLEGFNSARIIVGGIPLDVAVARTPQQQGQGLMHVTDMPDGAGMIFLFPEERATSFWMKDTLIPLDIAFFDANRRLVGSLTMVPCTADPCPTYSPGAPFKFAVEANEGTFTGLRPRARLRLGNIDD
jgi:uncharacterized protein